MNAGLCDSCRHVQRLRNDRGSTFYLCGLASIDPRFTRYPTLPVVRCAGYTPHVQPPLPPSGKNPR